LKVVIDDLVVQELDMSAHPELKHRLKRGYIGFPDMGHVYRVRSIRLEELPDRVQFVGLFDGRTLDGWQLRDGAIHGSNGNGILYAKPVFGDFELTAAVRSHGHVNSGFFLRGAPAGGRIYPAPTSIGAAWGPNTSSPGS